MIETYFDLERCIINLIAQCDKDIRSGPPMERTPMVADAVGRKRAYQFVLSELVMLRKKEVPQ